ncbi:uncharacterized protein L201_006089 [Kwoniella dendrophila CBS 6074]|uniref:SH3 domain-containing protein n=1 Tax=Kwoniella dendrophila CBS 6074 TaxID=1295534 RepID=A0AAX4K1W4_9TREE
MGLNSPLPVRLEEETRKAAKILRSFVDVNNNGLDKVIPRHILERAAGFAIFTVFKAGFVLTARAGSGIVIARLEDGSWSPPSAIGLGGFGFGGQAGAEVTDFLVVLNSRSAVTSFMSAGSLTLGGNLSVAVGPLGRNAEGSGSVNTKGRLAAMYSYSKTKGLFGGVSVEGSVIVERQDANRIAYGGNPNAKQILSGTFDPPDWAYVLIEQLEKATGLPGGQRWIERDEDGEGGGMGYGHGHERGKHGGSSSNGAGYVFGQGVGAGGNSPNNTGSGRRSRGNSLFGGSNDRNNNMPTSPGMGSGSPVRPSSSRKGSSFNPFNSGTNSPKRGYLEHSSENYSSNPNYESTSNNASIGLGIGNGGRSRSGSLLKNGEVPQPFSYMNPSKAQSPLSQSQKDKDKNTDLLGDWGNSDDPFSSSAAAAGGGRRKASGGEKDLLGQWESNGNQLSAQFSSLKTNDNYHTTRSRSNSRPTPFEGIPEKKEMVDYTPRETESKFANMDWSNYSNNASASGSNNFISIASGQNQHQRQRSNSPTKKARPFSSYISGSGNNSPSLGYINNNNTKDFSPFEDLPVGRLRSNSNEDGSKPFESYSKYSSNNNVTIDHDRFNGSQSNKPELRLKEGLSGDHDTNNLFEGYAKAIGLFDFNSTESGDLTFKSGQVIIILDKVDSSGGKWWKGYSPISKKQGIFPSNYIEVIELPKKPKGNLTWSELRKRVGGNEFDQ